MKVIWLQESAQRVDYGFICTVSPNGKKKKRKNPLNLDTS